MWVVRLALGKPHVVIAALLLLVGATIFSLRSMPIDILPSVDTPAIYVLWSYPGLSTADMERRIVINHERIIAAVVDNVARIESFTTPGQGIIRVYFHPGSELGTPLLQMQATAQYNLRYTPPGTLMPFIGRARPSDVPVAQITVSSDTLPEDKIFDYANSGLRYRIFSLPGVGVLSPAGGRTRQLNVDLKMRELTSIGLTPTEVMKIVGDSNLILSAGSIRIGATDFGVELNSSPTTIEEFTQIPVKNSPAGTLLLRDVATVSDGPGPLLNIVRVNGYRATFISILKKVGASTLSVVESIKQLLPMLRESGPKDINLTLDMDQSVFVRSALKSVFLEALIAGTLVCLLILFFLKSWRSVIIICTSIPLAILFAILGLDLFGHTLNIMSLGGLSLAVGMLIDDAAVEVENVHRNRSLGLPLTKAILTSAEQVALPAIISTATICLVFSPVALLEGSAKYLMTPLALAVIFAMTASYILSRTLVPLLCRTLLESEKHEDIETGQSGSSLTDKLIFKPYEILLRASLRFRLAGISSFAVLAIISASLVKVVGLDVFPTVDTGVMKFLFRAPAGTRIEETEKLVAKLEEHIRSLIPAGELKTITSIIGPQPTGNTINVPSDVMGAMDSEVLVLMQPNHQPSKNYLRQIREGVAKNFPGCSIRLLPSDIISQVLDFGLSSPIDVQLSGFNFPKVIEYATQLGEKMRGIKGLEDVQLKQVLNYPTLQVEVDRIKASKVGLSQKDVAYDVLVSLVSSFFVSPSYFLNPSNGVTYGVVVQTPHAVMESVDDLMSIPVSGLSQASSSRSISSVGPSSEILGDISTAKTVKTVGSISHIDVMKTLNLVANVEGRDFGSTTSDLDDAVKSLGPLPPGTFIKVRGQKEVLTESFTKMAFGLLIAIFLVYLLMATLYQSWLDPIIAMSSIPGGLIGVLWILFLTKTTLNIESMMGALMVIGISTANSILLVSFANDWRATTGGSALEAAFEAGRTRLRPVLMTALAMILGMIPTALALGEAGEQNAPLGMAVIGGLIMSTGTTLIIVPMVYAVFRTTAPTPDFYEERLRREMTGGSL